jgi:hypothetical protein
MSGAPTERTVGGHRFAPAAGRVLAVAALAAGVEIVAQRGYDGPSRHGQALLVLAAVAAMALVKPPPPPRSVRARLLPRARRPVVTEKGLALAVVLALTGLWLNPRPFRPAPEGGRVSVRVVDRVAEAGPGPLRRVVVTTTGTGAVDVGPAGALTLHREMTRAGTVRREYHPAPAYGLVATLGWEPPGSAWTVPVPPADLVVPSGLSAARLADLEAGLVSLGTTHIPLQTGPAGDAMALDQALPDSPLPPAYPVVRPGASSDWEFPERRGLGARMAPQIAAALTGEPPLSYYVVGFLDRPTGGSASPGTFRPPPWSTLAGWPTNSRDYSSLGWQLAVLDVAAPEGRPVYRLAPVGRDRGFDTSGRSGASLPLRLMAGGIESWRTWAYGVPLSLSLPERPQERRPTGLLTAVTRLSFPPTPGQDAPHIHDPIRVALWAVAAVALVALIARMVRP